MLTRWTFLEWKLLFAFGFRPKSIVYRDLYFYAFHLFFPFISIHSFYSTHSSSNHFLNGDASPAMSLRPKQLFIDDTSIKKTVIFIDAASAVWWMVAKNIKYHLQFIHCRRSQRTSATRTTWHIRTYPMNRWLSHNKLLSRVQQLVTTERSHASRMCVTAAAVWVWAF